MYIYIKYRYTYIRSVIKINGNTKSSSFLQIVFMFILCNREHKNIYTSEAPELRFLNRGGRTFVT